MSGYLDVAANVIDIEIAALQHGKERLTTSFKSAVDLILSCVPPGRVIVMGMGKSGHIANKIAATLASTGTPSFFVHPAEAGHGDLGMITQQDVVVAISQSGKSDELLRVLPYLKRNDIRLIALTGGLQSVLAEHSDLIINTEVPKEACPLGLAPTASTTLTLALGDALAICLLEARGFQAEQFAQTHPHGSLGRRLLTYVENVMSARYQAPIVDSGTTILDALIAISKVSMGFVVVEDSSQYPIGIFTDGDLRRALQNDINIKVTLIDSVMSQEFTSIFVNKLAAEAADLMEKNKISALPVLDEQRKLVGTINMRQLLQAGVV